MKDLRGTSVMPKPVIVTHLSRRAEIRVLALLLLFVTGAARQAGATAIVVGPRIDLSPTTFALPIDIIDGIAVVSWQFDLTYDASDVQVNTGCDPFSGDPYCSLLTGPVTEGDFFASGAPFNVLIPGFIDLDPVTFAQTGLLFGVNGAFGGFPPLPSGNGTLAFVEFTILGDGSSVITVDGSVVTAVPEPGTLALFTTALLLPGARRLLRRSRRMRSGRSADTVDHSCSIDGGQAMRHGLICASGLLVLGTLTLSVRAAEAQTTAVGPYYATPSWDQTIACTTPANCPRFVVLSNFASQAVLDRETGLVWERSPSTTLLSWFNAARHCNQDTRVGNRMGWRVPSLHELTSLIDPTASFLPAGHPFSNVQTQYWSATRIFDTTGGPNFFAWSVAFTGSNQIIPLLLDDMVFVWCVRGGGQGVDAQ